MEFSLSPVPGSPNKANIYQRTKLLLDEDYVSRLGQFEQRLRQGTVKRQGRYIEGSFVDCDYLKSVDLTVQTKPLAENTILSDRLN
jgi:hypothetical protein